MTAAEGEKETVRVAARKRSITADEPERCRKARKTSSMGVWALEQVDGPLKLQLFDTCPRTIGRSEECDLHLSGLIWISRKHCYVRATRDGVEVNSVAQADLCVKVDGSDTPKDTTALLRHGSKLRLGDTQCSVIFRCTLQSC